MKKDHTEKKSQVVIIGGGLGGLSAAAILARKGFPVTLIEQHSKPGGYATSFKRSKGRFTFEVSLHAMNTADAGPLKNIFSLAGIEDKVKVVALPELCRIITPDHDMVWPQRNPEAIVDLLCQRFPDESNGIHQFFKEMETCLDDAKKPFNQNSLWEKLIFPFTHKNWWRIRNQTIGNIIDTHIQNAELKTIISTFWIYYLLPPSKLSGFIYLLATGMYIWAGAYYIKYQSQDLSNAFSEAIRKAGGKILLSTEAVGINIKDGRVCGVRLKDGKILKARSIISNASVPATMEMISDSSTQRKYKKNILRYLNKLKKYRPSLSSFIVWLGLNREITGKVDCHQTFIVKNNDPDDAYNASLSCDPISATSLVTIYDNTYPGYSQPGTSTISIYMPCGYDPWRPFESDYFAGQKDAYRKKKSAITETLIDQVEKNLIPGLKSMIEVKESATPLTNIRYTKNPEGAICGYEWSMDNSFMTRIENTTPFKGLFLSSAWGNGGGSYILTMDSGYKAYQAVVRDWQKKG